MKNSLIRRICAALTGVICLSSCGQLPNNAVSTRVNSIPVDSITASVTPDSFDEALLSYISDISDGNYMVSPLSFRYALGLLLLGAEGNTKPELLNALGVESVDEWTTYALKFNGFVEQFDQWYATLLEQFDDGVKNGWYDKSDKPVYALKVANSIWKRNDIDEPFKDGYCQAVSENYAAEYREFTAKNAVKLVNEWASQKTEKMIPELLPKDYNTDDLAVVLMNALYFKDSWANTFSEYATEDGDFTTADGKKITKSFMQQTEYFSYYADKQTRLVTLPMEGGIYMTFVLGDTADIGSKIDKAESRSVNVRIPKIDLETSFSNKELMDFLKFRGVIDAFDSKTADFSAMIDHQIWVDDIIQKTKLKLDEDGVEAAAVTAIMMVEGCCIDDEPEAVVFDANQPFSFYIHTNCNGMTAILFAGEIVE